MSPSDDDEPTTIARPGLHGGQHNEAARDIYGASRDMQIDSSSGQHVHVNVNVSGAAPKAQDSPRKDEPKAAPPGEQAGKVPESGTGSHPRRAPRRPQFKVAAAIGATVALLFAGIVINRTLTHSQETAASRNAQTPMTIVRMAGGGLFFSDPDVIKALQQQHIVVQQAASLGSRQICIQQELLANYDNTDSGSREAATCVVNLAHKAGKNPDEASPYQQLMIIITYQPIVDLLERLGVASKVPSGITVKNHKKVENYITVFNEAKYLKVFASGKRWTDIPKHGLYPNPSRIMLSITNPKQSNSGGMLADIAYAAQIRGDTPTGIGPHDPYVPVIRSLFTELGSLETHTPVLVSEFLRGSMGTDPMAMAYESDYLGAVLSDKARDPNLTVMYPTPDVFPEETFVAWTPAGSRLIKALQSPALIAAEKAGGYRTNADLTGFVKYMADTWGVTVPDLYYLERTLQLTRLPTEVVLEELIDAVATSQPG